MTASSVFKSNGRQGPGFPLKLGPEMVTHVVWRGRNATAALWSQNTPSHSNTPVGLLTALLFVVGHECSSSDTMRSVCANPRFVWAKFFTPRWRDAHMMIKHKNKYSLCQTPPLAASCTPHCGFLHEAIWLTAECLSITTMNFNDRRNKNCLCFVYSRFNGLVNLLVRERNTAAAPSSVFIPMLFFYCAGSIVSLEEMISL